MICAKPVLLGNKQYWPGDELPNVNAELAEAWQRNGVAKSENTKSDAPAKAKVIAEPGLVGEAIPKTGDEPEMVGKLPARELRTAPSIAERKGKKKSE